VWQRLGRFLKEDDIVLAESGTAQFGVPDSTFPPNTRYITQIFWSSIGFTVGACFGALVAAKELKHSGRVVLIVGEGSLQMTVQEIGSYIRYGYKPIIFVINNDGYAIERAIHGPEQGYNDVSMLWDHQKMLEFFGAREDTGIKAKSRSTKTVEELEAVLTDEDFGSCKEIQVSECYCTRLWTECTDDRVLALRNLHGQIRLPLETIGANQRRERANEASCRGIRCRECHWLKGGLRSTDGGMNRRVSWWPTESERTRADEGAKRRIDSGTRLVGQTRQPCLTTVGSSLAESIILPSLEALE